MSADKEKASRGSGAILVVALLLVVLLPVLYVLSVGPVAWFYQSVPDPEWIDVVYWPLIKLMETSPAFADLLAAYVRLWKD